MQRVLIIRPGALGDTLMLLPALSDFSGKAAVTFVGRQPGLEFIRPYVDRAMDLERSGWHRLFLDPPDGGPLPVSEKDANIVTAFFNDPDGVIRRNLQASLPHADVHVFRSFPVKGELIHVAEYLARCLACAGLPVDPTRSMAAMRSVERCSDRGLSERQKRIVFQPGSGSPKKNYPSGFWIDLAGRFRRDELFKDFKRIFLLGPAEEPLHVYFSEHLGSGVADIAASWDGDLILKTLDGAALYVGHDSGVTHLSAMRCVPTVALFRDSDPNQWSPLGPLVRVIEAGGPGPVFIERIVGASKVLVGSAIFSSQGGGDQMDKRLE